MELFASDVWLSLALVLSSLFVFLSTIFLFVWKARSKKRYSPFTEESLRLPGHSLRTRYNDEADEIVSFYIATIFSAIGLAWAAIKLSGMLRVAVISATLFCMIFVLIRTWKLLEKLRRMRLGKEGEEYVGQELNLLMCRGAHVFHDIPYAYGNIDHLVVGFDKVFVVETKAISKPKTEGKENSRDSVVVFDGEKLLFPHKTTADPIIQAKIHAKYVREVLKKKCGLDFTVVPVVAIPGWFVESKNTTTDILVINPKRGKALDAWLGPKEGKATRNQVAVYLESVARSVSLRSKLTDPDASTKYDFWFNPRYVEPELR